METLESCQKDCKMVYGKVSYTMRRKRKKVFLGVFVLIMLFGAVNIWGRLIVRYMDCRHIVHDATVCEETGNLSFLTADYRIMTYNTSGELLWEASLTDHKGGYGHVNYCDGCLQVEVYRSNLLITYDENGNVVNKEEVVHEDFVPDWEHSWNKNKKQKQFSTNSHEYIYAYPSLWEVLRGNDEVFFTIRSIDTEEEVRINLK